MLRAQRHKVGEVFFELDGDFTVCGMPAGKLRGSLRDQLDAFGKCGKGVEEKMTFA